MIRTTRTTDPHTPARGRAPGRRVALTAAAGLLTGALALVPTAASAHVTVSPDRTVAGGYSLLTFGIPHGCSGSATTQVSIQIPDEIVRVTPSVSSRWDVEKVMEPLDPPVDDGHGGQRTERVSEVVYTAVDPLPDGYRDAVSIQVQLPDLPGETLYFPAVQVCEEGESPWIQLPEEGQTSRDLELPAPGFVLTAAEDAGAAATEDGDEAEIDTAGAETVAYDAGATGEGGAPAALTWAALVVGALGLVVGGLALALARSGRRGTAA
ncbi:YcnI family copper-binding membrane protein [Cellulomonas bogoriensis]|nr:YcnI family protein [Cellulomonas bogoriensis]